MKTKHTADTAAATKCTPAYRAMLRRVMPQVETHAERQKRLVDFLTAHFPDEGIRYSQLTELKGRESFSDEHCGLIYSLFAPWWESQVRTKRRGAGQKGGRPNKPKGKTVKAH